MMEPFSSIFLLLDISDFHLCYRFIVWYVDGFHRAVLLSPVKRIVPYRYELFFSSLNYLKLWMCLCFRFHSELITIWVVRINGPILCCASRKGKYWSVWPWIPMRQIFIINLRFYGNWSKWKDPNRQTTASGFAHCFLFDTFNRRSIECKRCPLYHFHELYMPPSWGV